MLYLFLLFTLTPLVELWLLFKLSGVFGFWTTIAVVLATGLAGAALARVQGFLALQRLRTDLAQGAVPAASLGDGVLILAAGLLLITPGVLTDVLGFSLLIPPFRSLVRIGLTKWLAGRVRIETQGRWEQTQSAQVGGEVIGGEVIDVQVVETRVVDDAAE